MFKAGCEIWSAFEHLQNTGAERLICNSRVQDGTCVVFTFLLEFMSNIDWFCGASLSYKNSSPWHVMYYYKFFF